MKYLVRILLIAFLPVMALGTAQAQVRKFDPVADIKSKIDAGISSNAGIKASGDIDHDLVRALDAKLLPDLQYALRLATASDSKVTAPCWQAWIDIINTQIKAVQDDKGVEIPLPDPSLITHFERLVELRNALQPDSNFMLKCSPVASMVKKDIASFMGVVISGGAGIASLVPGL